MTHKESKAPSLIADDQDASTSSMNNITKRPRTREDFYRFCTYILEYEKYELQRHEEDTRTTTRTPPPLDSSGSSVNSESATSSGQEEDKPSEDDTDADADEENDNNEDSYDLVTCYCRKPFAGRPMIECSRCLTWVHLSCARIRRTHIPDVFYCALCKHKQLRSPRNDGNRPGASPPGSPAMKRVKRGASL
ncbi:hypothetical protein CBL_14168 [Carabus blaptoides fortunei]